MHSSTEDHRRGVAGRALHLVDLENLVGDPDAGRGSVASALDAYVAGAAVGPADLVTVALNHRLYERCFTDLDRGWVVKLASGPDACDHVLIDAAPVGWVVERFDRLVVGSGDHAFVDLVHGVRRGGRPVWAVAQRRCLSRRLASAASRVVTMEPLALAA